MHGTRELDLANLVTTTGVEVVALSEAEVPAGAAEFALDGFTTFAPLVKPGEKTRVMILIKTDVAVKTNARLERELLSDGFPSVWVQLDSHTVRGGGRAALCGAVLLGAVYRRWGSPTSEKAEFEILKDQISRAGARKAIVLTGDMNLDVTRRYHTGYRHKAMLVDLQDATATAGFEYHNTPHTFRSYGLHSDGGAPFAHRFSTIDHTYTAGVVATVEVLDDYSSDHRPMVLTINAGGDVSDAGRLVIVKRRNFKRLRRQQLEDALRAQDWDGIYQVSNVNSALEYLNAGIVAALDMVAPVKEVTVNRGKNLYLTQHTLNLMKQRDMAKGAKYRKLRNRCSVLVERDKRASNESKLDKSKNDPRVLWELANAALGKPKPTLPLSLLDASGSMTVGKVATASAMNDFFIKKVVKLREPLLNCPPSEKNEWPKKKSPFEFRFCNAGKVAKIIKGLKSTAALGVDGIPVGVLKLGSEVLSGPISHVVNRSLASGKVPDEFKRGIVRPIYKGNGKDRKEPSSYRPVCILTALSKVLETTVKQDLCAHISKTGAIPTTQHGFRAGRSCSTALASAHAGWLKDLKEGKIVGLLGFDLSSAFDTLDPSALLNKLSALGITGRPHSWFHSYLIGGYQCVDWDGAISSFVEVLYGVRQGSILGPVLFNVHTADMAAALGNAPNVTYADDSNAWTAAKTLEEVKSGLQVVADRFVRWAKGNGLAVNALKTQLLVSSNGGYVGGFNVNVDGKSITATDEFDLLGVTYNRVFSTTLHDARVAKSVRQRASLIARLSHHLKRGNYLRQLAAGLVLGKISHALPAVATPRLSAADGAANAAYKSVQVSVNDVCRVVTGKSRRDCVPVTELLSSARMLSVNAMVTTAVALEAWKAHRSTDGDDGGRNPVGSIVFDSAAAERQSRATAAGLAKVPLRGYTTMVTAAATVWNTCPELRAAKSLGQARAAARNLARGVPL